MHVLVIGGNRFIGPLLVWRLLARGDRVTLLNRGSLPDPFGERVTRLVGDRTTDLGRLVGGLAFDAVVDFAAFTGEDGRGAVAAFGGRIAHYVMVSSGQVYLVRDGAPRPAREEHYDGPVVPRPSDARDLREWSYGMGKRACEDALVEASGFPATRLRIPMVNGERDHMRRLEGYLWRLVDGGPVLVPGGGGHQVRHVYAGEVARFIAEVIGDASTMGRAYNLAQRETPTLLEMLGFAREMLGSRAELVPVDREALVARGLDPLSVSPFSGTWMSFVDPSFAEHELGFVHEPLESYLGKIVASFMAFPSSDRPAGYASRKEEMRLAAGR